MLSKSQANRIVSRLTRVLGKNINIFNEDGVIIASGDKSRIGKFHYGAKLAAEKKGIVYVDEKFMEENPDCKEGVNLAAYDNNEFLCIIGITGKINEVKNYAHIVKEFVELMCQEFERNKVQISQEKTFRNFGRELIHKQGDLDRFYLYPYPYISDFKFEKDRRVVVFEKNRTDQNSKGSSQEIVFEEDEKNEFYAKVRKAIQKDDIFFYLKENIFILIAGDEELEDEIQRIREIFPNVTRIGIGTICCKKEEYSDSYEAAMKILKLGRDMFPEQEVFRFEDYKIELLADEASDFLINAYGNTFPVLADYLSCHEEMAETIRCFHRKGMNVTETAKELHLHRNTVLYRLNKIKTEFGYDLFDSRVCMEIYILILFALRHG